MKSCTTCRITKPETAFGKRQRSKDGLQSSCRECRTKAVREWRSSEANRVKQNAWNQVSYERNKEAIIAQHKQYVAENREACNAVRAKWAREHPESARATYQRAYAKNPTRFYAKNRKRFASKLQATPAWANDFFIEEAYRLARRRTKVTGIKWHVDHIVPLRSRVVCGLHTHTNLQVIPSVENCRKGNSHWPNQ